MDEWTADALRQLNHEHIFWQLDHPFIISKAMQTERGDKEDMVVLV